MKKFFFALALLSSSVLAEDYPATMAIGDASFTGTYDPSMQIFQWDRDSWHNPYYYYWNNSNVTIVHKEGPFPNEYDDPPTGSYIIQVITRGVLHNEDELYISVSYSETNPWVTYHDLP
jgi:hypothetical protein